MVCFRADDVRSRDLVEAHEIPTLAEINVFIVKLVKRRRLSVQCIVVSSHGARPEGRQQDGARMPTGRGHERIATPRVRDQAPVAVPGGSVSGGVCAPGACCACCRDSSYGPADDSRCPLSRVRPRADVPHVGGAGDPEGQGALLELELEDPRRLFYAAGRECERQDSPLLWWLFLAGVVLLSACEGWTAARLIVGAVSLSGWDDTGTRIAPYLIRPRGIPARAIAGPRPRRVCLFTMLLHRGERSQTPVSQVCAEPAA